MSAGRPSIWERAIAAVIGTESRTVPAVRTVNPERTFWDKIVILHGLRRWFDTRTTGKSAAGHDFPARLDEGERRQVEREMAA